MKNKSLAGFFFHFCTICRRSLPMNDVKCPVFFQNGSFIFNYAFCFISSRSKHSLEFFFVWLSTRQPESFWFHLKPKGKKSNFVVNSIDFFDIHLRLSLLNSSTDILSTPYGLVRECKKLRRLLQRKHHTKLELCVRLSVCDHSTIGHAVQNRRSALSIAYTLFQNGGQ